MTMIPDVRCWINQSDTVVIFVAILVVYGKKRSLSSSTAVNMHIT